VASAGVFGRDGDSIDCLKSNSRAWCTLDAAKMTMLGLKDVNAADVQKQIDVGGNEGVWWYGGAVAGLGNNFFKPAPGLSSGVEIGVLVLRFLGGSLSPEALGWNGVFGWMPLSEAASEDDARSRAATLVRESTLKTFSRYKMELEWEPTEEQKAEYTVEAKGRPVFILKGGDCDQKVCKLSLLNYWGATQKVKRPEWLGGGEAWGVAVGYGVRGASLAPWKLTIDGVDLTASYLQELSASLPEWAYVWVSPEVKKKWGKVNVGQRVPGIYTKGGFLPLVFPEVKISKIEEPRAAGVMQAVNEVK
jgi:hypothetical protein